MFRSMVYLDLSEGEGCGHGVEVNHGIVIAWIFQFNSLNDACSIGVTDVSCPGPIHRIYRLLRMTSS